MYVCTASFSKKKIERDKSPCKIYQSFNFSVVSTFKRILQNFAQIKFYLKWSKNQDPGPIHYLMAALLVFFECVLFCYKPNKKTVHL